MTEMDGRDPFYEANMLLSNTLKQLDEVMSKGRLHEVRASSMPNESFSSMTEENLIDDLSPNSTARLIEDYRNGNPKSAFTIVDQMGNYNGAQSFLTNGNVYNPTSPTDQRCSDPSSTWEENVHRDTNSLGSIAESSTGESPLSEIHSASTNTSNFSVDRFVKAIETEKLPVPNLKTRYKILKWISENGTNETVSLLFLFKHKKSHQSCRKEQRN
ncbi:hypothetical protein M3Y98_00366100 [Aphelenchoides besseyi]|nr:hypothetical protein M3Y98_00366100 [Aphelenchoides besseyi]